MKKYLCIGTVIAALLMTMVNVYAEEKYNDIDKSHWAYSYISEMSEDGIISGYTDGSFKPLRQVTYGEFIKMIYISQTGMILERPKAGHWALNYYNEGIKIGLYERDDVGFSDLDKVIPRKKMALMTANSLDLETESSKNEADVLKEISDVNSDTEYAEEIAASYNSGILNGYPDKSFRPEAGLSRAEAAAAIYRLGSKTDINNVKTEYIGKEKVKNANFEVEKYNTKLGYNGIMKFVYSKESDCIGVYSDKIQDITLFIDGKKAAQVVNAEGEYWKEDGYYVYVFKANGANLSGKPLGVAFGLYLEDVYYYTDASL